ncbi:MAG: carbon monoxide dehydrogenase subunit G [Alphaproteobacteria bacterium]
MDMKGEYRIPAAKQVVWEALNDPEILKACIPGCETIDKTSETEMTATVKAKVGPVSARFKGKVTLSDLNPPSSYRISGEGQGGPAGFGKGGATVTLEEDGGDTVLRYEANAQVGGKLAQIGARLVDGAAKKIADEFFSNFAAHVGGAAAAGAAPAAAPAGGETPGPALAVNHETAEKPSKTISTATWIVGLVAVVAVVLLLFSVL